MDECAEREMKLKERLKDIQGAFVSSEFSENVVAIEVMAFHLENSSLLFLISIFIEMNAFSFFDTDGANWLSC